MIDHFVTLMILVPFIVAIAQFLRGPWILWVGLLASSISSLMAFAVIASMRSGISELQATELLPWIGAFSISYDVGVDGLSAVNVLLVAILFPVILISEWKKAHESATGRGVYGLFLFLQGTLLGLAVSQNLFLILMRPFL